MIRSLKFLALIFSASILFTSCTMEETYTFNDDMSGNYELSVDFSALMTMMGELEDLDMPLDENVDETKKLLDAAEGISNGSFEMADGKASLKFDFSSLEAMDNIAMQGQTFAGLLHPTIKKKGKKVEIDLSPGNMDNEAMAAIPEDDEFSGLYEESFEMVTNIRFNRPVKKFKGDVGEWDEESNTISYRYKMSDLTNPDLSWKSSVKLK